MSDEKRTIGTKDSKQFRCCNHPDRPARLPSHVLCEECFASWGWMRSSRRWSAPPSRAPRREATVGKLECVHGGLARSCYTCELQAGVAAAEARIAELTAALERVTNELEWKQAEADDAHKDVNEWASRYDQLRADLERERASHERDLSRASEITRGAMDDRDAARASLGQALRLLRESESGKMCSAALEGEAMCSELPACYLHRRAAFLAAHPTPEPTKGPR